MNIPLIEKLDPNVEEYGRKRARLNVELSKDLDNNFGGGIKRYLPGMQKSLKGKIRKMQASVSDRLSKESLNRKSVKQQAVDSTNASIKSLSAIAPTIPTKIRDFKVIKGNGKGIAPKRRGIMASAFPRRLAA